MGLGLDLESDMDLACCCMYKIAESFFLNRKFLGEFDAKFQTILVGLWASMELFYMKKTEDKKPRDVDPSR
jgi:hypothetical protein